MENLETPALESTHQDMTIEFVKKASVLRRISLISAALLLVSIPILILTFKQLNKNEVIIYSGLFISLLVVWFISTRSYNILNLKIKMNFWLDDMLKNPYAFQRYVNENNIKEKTPN